MQISPALRARVEERAREVAEKNEAVSGANSDPLPGPLYEAFARGAIKIRDGLFVRKCVARDWVILRGVNSPLLKIIEESQKNPDKPASIECQEWEQWLVCWQFITPIQVVRDAYADGQGLKTMRERAELEVGDVLSVGEINLVLVAVMEQVRRAWECAMKYSMELDQSGEITFFRDAVESQKMDSAGGSTTLPASQPSASTAQTDTPTS